MAFSIHVRHVLGGLDSIIFHGPDATGQAGDIVGRNMLGLFSVTNAEYGLFPFEIMAPKGYLSRSCELLFS